MRRFSQLLVVLAILLLGTLAIPYAAFPSEPFRWQLLGGAYGADLSVTKLDNPDPVTVGNNLTYTIIATNNGPAEATGVKLKDKLPKKSVSFGSATPSQGKCHGRRTITCNLGNLTNGASATVTIVVTPTTAGTSTNTVNIWSKESDPNTADNMDIAVTTILQ